MCQRIGAAFRPGESPFAKVCIWTFEPPRDGPLRPPVASPPVPCVIAIDAGTTGVRALAVAEDGAVVDVSYREFPQYFPHPAWVEHDATAIWQAAAETVTEVAQRQSDAGRPIAAIGITNQRETVVAWDRSTGAPLHRAIVWQDRRTAGRCDELRRAGHL